MKHAHGQGKTCTECPQIFSNTEKLRSHRAKHHKKAWKFTCEVCKITFKTLNEAREHSNEPCGNMKYTDDINDTEESNDTNRCNACSINFSSNQNLEMHMEKEHHHDCSSCQKTFKTQDDVYKHANKCHVINGPYMCNKCNRELVSKAGLAKHIERCKGEENLEEEYNEACTNGPDCKFKRQNRCLYRHDESDEQPWQKVQSRRQGKQQARQQQPRQQVQSRQQQPGQQGLLRQQQPRQQVQSRQKLPRQQVQSRQQDECRNGLGCIYWKYNRCHFTHSGPRPRHSVDSRQSRGSVDSRRSSGSVDSRQSRGSVDSRQSRGGLDSRQSQGGLDSRQHNSRTEKPCKFGSGCDRILSCGFLHSAKDFLSAQGGRRK